MYLIKNYIDNLYGFNCDCYDIFIEDNKIGTIGLYFNDGKAFCDTFIIEKHRRKGYALLAKKLLFEQSGLEKVYSWVNKTNIKSINLQYKMGCTLIEETDDKLLFMWKNIKGNIMLERKYESEEFVVRWLESPELKQQIYEKVIQWYISHEAFSAESIMQSDGTQIDAAPFLAELADKTIHFKAVSMDTV